jgi:hypothetical protein
MAEVDRSLWSGEGLFTQLLLDRLAHLPAVAFIRVENAPASRSGADYNLVSNELFVRFATRRRIERIRRLGFIRATRVADVPAMNLAGLAAALEALDGVGTPDYGDEGMLQFLRTERVIPPYQTRGYKLVELVRLYEVGTPSRANALDG